MHRIAYCVAIMVATIFVPADARANIRIASSTPLAAARPFGMPSDRDRASAISSAWRRHEAGRKPIGWTEAAARIRAEQDADKKIQLALNFVDHGITQYVDREGGPWTLTPAEAFARGGLCRDFSAAYAFLLLDGGYPSSDIRLVTLAPDGAAPRYHVVTLVRTPSGVVAMDMRNRHSHPGYLAPLIGRDEGAGTNHRMPVAAVAADTWTASRKSAETKIADSGSAIRESEDEKPIAVHVGKAPHHRNHHARA